VLSILEIIIILIYVVSAHM